MSSVSRKCLTVFPNSTATRIKARNLLRCCPIICPVFRPAIETMDSAGGLHRFGNMTLSRLPVLQIANHLLPWPGAGATRSMRRHALEVTVQAAFGALRIVNTHLEYHSARSARSADCAAAGPAAGGVDEFQSIGFPAQRALRESDAWRRRACCAVISTSMSPTGSMH